jgi:hypothetical protein
MHYSFSFISLPVLNKLIFSCFKPECLKSEKSGILRYLISVEDIRIFWFIWNALVAGHFCGQPPTLFFCSTPKTKGHSLWNGLYNLKQFIA